MAPEIAVIDALAAYLATPGLLLPAPLRIGAAEPAAAAELPAIVLSLEEVHRLGAGLGERAALVTGALAVQARIDLANPVLPDEPGFRLLSDDRRTLVMPHGGWVKADGSSGLLAGADLQVSVSGDARSVVNAAPGPGEVQPAAPVGTLLFGTPLPAAGLVLATYFLGQWERRATPLAGLLRIDVRAASAADVVALSAALAAALDDAAALPRGLRKVALGRVGSVGAPVAELAASRGRSLACSFEYEHEINRPDSSGGIIRRIPITTRLAVTTVDRASGAIVTTQASEVDS